MFNGIKEFFELLDVNPIWPAIILIAECINCTIPYTPIGKVKKSKEKDDTVYIVYKNRK